MSGYESNIPQNTKRKQFTQNAMMDYRAHEPTDAPAIARLFSSVFTASEGESEGTLIGNLSKELLATTDRSDLFGFVAVDQEEIVGTILLSRLRFETDTEAFLLAPVAIHSEYQGKGIGQALITHGLQAIKKKDVEIVITYGDPAFYSNVGFQPLSQETVPAPYELSQPEGWLGQSLTDDSIETIAGPCSCVEAFDDPAYW